MHIVVSPAIYTEFIFVEEAYLSFNALCFCSFSTTWNNFAVDYSIMHCFPPTLDTWVGSYDFLY